MLLGWRLNHPREICCWAELFGIILGNEKGELGPTCVDFAEFFIVCNASLPLGSLP